MNAVYRKWLTLFLILILSASALCACQQGPDLADPSESAESGTSADTVTDAVTIPPETEPVLMDEQEAKALLASALTATQAQTVYQNTAQYKVESNDLTVIDTTSTVASDGESHKISVLLAGIETTYTFMGNTLYYSTGGHGFFTKYAVTLTEDRKQQLLDTGISAESPDLSVIMSPEAFLQLSGERQSDGSVVLTATDVSDEVKQAMGGAENMTVTVTSCALTVNAQGLISSLELSYSITIPETDYSAGMSMAYAITQTSVYEDVDVAAPSDADQYTVESYEAVFERSVPLNSQLEAAKMPLDGDGFVINTLEGSEEEITAQAGLLTEFPHLYADKSFTITATVGLLDDFPCIVIGDAQIFLDYPQEVLGPLEDDVIKIDVKFEKIGSGEEIDLSHYVFYMESYEIIERPQGPNGGIFMFVDVNSSLNVRPAPTTAGNSPIGSFLRGEVVEVLEITDGWAKIVYAESESGYAYVSAQYLSES